MKECHLKHERAIMAVERSAPICELWGVVAVAVLRLSCRPSGAGFVVDVGLEGAGAPRSASVPLGWEVSAQDREDVRWYLEDFLQYPVDPAPRVARRVEGRLQALGSELFARVFRSSPDAMMVWGAVAGELAQTRVEVVAGAGAPAVVPWEWLRDPATDGALAVRAGAFVRTHPEAAVPVRLPAERAAGLRVLLVICRPGGRQDVPFRSVASHLVRLSRTAREAFQLDVLRPPTFAALARVLEQAKAAGEPYQVVHFDGHGAWLDAQAATAAAPAGGFNRNMFSVVSPPREGEHGFLVFEDPADKGRQQLVDGPVLGQLLADTGVPVLVLNACRSAHAGLATEPGTVAEELDAHRRVRAYGSLAQEVMDAGVAGVVAMGYNVYVVTAAKFIGDVYAALLAGRALGEAVTAARRQLHADPVRTVSLAPQPLQDWVVPVVYEAAPLTLLTAPAKTEDLRIDLDREQAGQERAAVEGGLPGGPDVGFYGRDESLLALDRAFDTAQIVLLHAWAGAGKTTTAAEFARWYALTGGTAAVLFTSFEHRLTVAGVLDQAGHQFGPLLERSGVQWAVLTEAQRRDIMLQLLGQVPVLWIWDNIEQVAGFPTGTPSAWTPEEQHDLKAFLTSLADTKCKVLLTSRRDEQTWLGDLPARIDLPPMPMLERLELARAVAARQPGGAQLFLEVEDWQPLLDFTQGNPLTISILTRQALRDQHTTRAGIESFVTQLRTGAAQVTDDATQGREASLAASLDYGFTHAFTEDERAILALLALFQGFIDIDTLVAMGDPQQPGGPVPAVTSLTRARIALLDRAAEVGLLTAHGDGYYDVHPAIPIHLHHLFTHHYGPPDSPTALTATHAWTQAISDLGNYYAREYGQGHGQVIGALEAEEANLLQARRVALQHNWLDLVIGTMQGLNVLYRHTGRTLEWRRLVPDLIPVFTDPATNGPRPGHEEAWAFLTGYRVGIAQEARDWDTARQLLNSRIAWSRQQAAAALATPPDQLTGNQRTQIRNLAVSLEQLGHLLREQGDPECVQPYQEAIELFQRIGARREESVVAFNMGHAYMVVPALRDLDQAQHWYQRRLELLGEHDTLGRARTVGQLGNIAHERFKDARKAGASKQQLLAHLNDSASAYHQALELFPDDATNELGLTHQALGGLYGYRNDIARALSHYQNALRYFERGDNRYEAGRTCRNAAITLAEAGRLEDALHYAQAALRDYQAIGPGAATEADQADQLITAFRQAHHSEPTEAQFEPPRDL
jgi:tetratricopeptide (TPR) repeat protein